MYGLCVLLRQRFDALPNPWNNASYEDSDRKLVWKLQRCFKEEKECWALFKVQRHNAKNIWSYHTESSLLTHTFNTLKIFNCIFRLMGRILMKRSLPVQTLNHVSIALPKLPRIHSNFFFVSILHQHQFSNLENIQLNSCSYLRKKQHSISSSNRNSPYARHSWKFHYFYIDLHIRTY